MADYAQVMRDLGFLAAFSGAVMGSCVIYIFPALMHIAVVKKVSLSLCAVVNKVSVFFFFIKAWNTCYSSYKAVYARPYKKNKCFLRPPGAMRTSSLHFSCCAKTKKGRGG
jgi:hypothetical protein